MAIVITRIGDRYAAKVTPPHGGGTYWRSPKPMRIDDLINALLKLGCHQTDIGDAFFDADPEWETRD